MGSTDGDTDDRWWIGRLIRARQTMLMSPIKAGMTQWRPASGFGSRFQLGDQDSDGKMRGNNGTDRWRPSIDAPH